MASLSASRLEAYNCANFWTTLNEVELFYKTQSYDRSIQRLMFRVEGRCAPRHPKGMATNTESRSDLEYVMLDHGTNEHPLQHPPHTPRAQPDTYTIETYVPYPIPSFPLSDRAAPTSELSSHHAVELPIPPMPISNRQPSSTTSAETTDLAQIRNALELSLERKLWLLPTKFKQKLAKYVTRLLLDSSNGTSRPNERAGEHNSNGITIHIQQEPFGGSEYHTNTQTESPCAPNFVLPKFSPPQSLFMMESMDSDQHSIRSDRSTVPNKYQRQLVVEDLDGRCFRVWVQFDTGAGSNFVSRGTLELLGRIKTHSIPNKYQEEYSSPIDENKKIKPTQSVFVKMWSKELNFFVAQAKLKIIDIERPGVFQIIIGRHLISRVNDRTGTSLLARLEDLDDDTSIAEPDMNLVGALIKDSRSDGMHSPTIYCRSNFANVYGTAQQAIDTAKNERNRQAYLERQKILGSSLSPSSSGLVRDNGSRSPETDKREAANQQPSSLPIRLDYHQGAAQQTTPSSIARFPDLRRTDTSSTQSTQYTQYSMERQSTSSTMSSLSDATLYTPKKGGRSAALRTQEE
jgi:hypothetical protein